MITIEREYEPIDAASREPSRTRPALTNESPSSTGAQFGHVASAESASYPVNVAIHQHKAAITDEDAATNWVTSFETSEVADWQFDFEGAAIERHEDTRLDESTASMWRFLVPAHEAEGVRGVSVPFEDGRDESDCHDVLADVARAIVESLLDTRRSIIRRLDG